MARHKRSGKPFRSPKAPRKPGEHHRHGTHPPQRPQKGFRARHPRDSDDELPRSLEEAARETDEKLSAWLSVKQGAKSSPTKSEPKEREDQAFTLDPWQAQAVDALTAGDSVIVDAPTTAGKTRVVEAFFAANIENPGFRAAYTTPVKSLTHDKLREFRARFGDGQVGIATGDIKENLGAPIVVCTLESYRNSLLGVEPDLGRSLVVFDEYHYLQDESRGSAWEEAMILTPPRCQILMLSASVANAEEICAWIKDLGRDRRCVLVRTTHRPVPLVDLVYVGGRFILGSALPAGFLRRLDPRRLDRPLRLEDIAPRAVALEAAGLTPAILYASRRMACEILASAVVRALAPIGETAAAKIGAALQAAHEEYKALAFMTPQMRQMLQVYGVCYHHSGLPAPARMAIEALVKGGLLRFCVATMGLSLGINFAVRSALISDYSRPGELGFTDYSPSEVLQMLGRAGRRGRDSVGFSTWPTVEAYAKLRGARRENVSSRLRNDPTTFLGLVGRGYSLRAIERFYDKSLRRYQDQRSDMTLFTKTRIQRHLGEGSEPPCSSPAAAVSQFRAKDLASPCRDCAYRPRCHPLFDKRGNGLSDLHLHLHQIGALNADEQLTTYGDIARYFPQAGGLLVAKYFATGRLSAANIGAAAELAAALSLARFKEPGFDSRYTWPFDEADVEAELEAFYPRSLFPELYDQNSDRRGGPPPLREFNPRAGFIAHSWLTGMAWRELTERATTEYFGTGDVMALLYRTGTYLQSVSQAGLPEAAKAARAAREVLLREPLALTLLV